VNLHRLDGAKLVVYNDYVAAKPKAARKKNNPKAGQKALVASRRA